MIRNAIGKEDFMGILALQRVNLKANISEEQRIKEGFVTVSHDEVLLEEMQSYLPQVIAVEGEKVIGYALSMVRELAFRIPVLIPMFQTIDTLSYQGNMLKDSHYYIMGQICIEEKFRGKGIFRELYQQHKKNNSNQYEYLITEVSTRNLRSLRAHQKLGFQNIYQYRDSTDEWNILLWDWNH